MDDLFCEVSDKKKNTRNQQLQKPAESLVNLKEIIKKDQESRDMQINIELSIPELDLSKNEAQEPDDKNNSNTLAAGTVIELTELI